MKKIVLLILLALVTSSLGAQSKHQSYTRKGDAVLYGDNPVPEADAESFQVLGHGYAKDFCNVYLDGKVLEYVDAASFKLTNKKPEKGRHDDSYYIGRWDVTYKGVKVADSFASSFTDLGGGYGKDKFSVFYQGKKIDGAVPSSFVIDDNGYAHDTFQTYFCGEKVVKKD